MATGGMEAKLFMGILASSEGALEKGKREIVAGSGAIDLESAVFPFRHTAYYNEEMGHSILRQFVSIRNLFDPGRLGEMKRAAIEMERGMSVGGKRQVNLDPGYLNMTTVVLATTKNAGHRVYLGDGIFAEATLLYQKGQFVPFGWTYPDYREEESLRFFAEVRMALKREARERRRLSRGGARGEESLKK